MGNEKRGAPYNGSIAIEVNALAAVLAKSLTPTQANIMSAALMMLSDALSLLTIAPDEGDAGKQDEKKAGT